MKVTVLADMVDFTMRAIKHAQPSKLVGGPVTVKSLRDLYIEEKTGIKDRVGEKFDSASFQTPPESENA